MYTGLGLAAKIDPATKEREEARIWMTVSLVTLSKKNRFCLMCMHKGIQSSPGVTSNLKYSFMPGIVIICCTANNPLSWRVCSSLLFECKRHEPPMVFWGYTVYMFCSLLTG